MDFCIYDSRLSAFKQPFGAVAAGETVRFSIHLPKNLCVKSAHLVLCCDGESDRFCGEPTVRFSGPADYGIESAFVELLLQDSA